MTQTMYGDASGRGAVSGYRVSIPARQHPYTEEEIAAVVNVMRNVDGQTQGTYLAKFQEDFAAFTGAKHAFAVDNATNALSLAATLCGIQPGDEVIIPAYTFCASAIPFGKAAPRSSGATSTGTPGPSTPRTSAGRLPPRPRPSSASTC